MLGCCGQVFRYAVVTGRAERDPSGDLRGALPPVKSQHFAAVTEPDQIAAVLRAIDGYERHLPRLRALPETELALLADREGHKVSTLLDYLGAWEANPERFAQRAEHPATTPATTEAGVHLAAYSTLTQQDHEEAPHGLH